MINLFINYYISSSIDRREELAECLSINKQQNVKIYCVIENDVRALGLEGVTLVVVDTQPTYEDMFKIAHHRSAQEDINIITNSDILFTDNTLKMIENNLKHGECYALTRWDMVDEHYQNAKFLDRKESQDAWCFRGPPKYIPKSNFLIGTRASDSRVALLIHQAGYNIKNPSKDVKIYHKHFYSNRTQELLPKVEGPYKVLPPHKLYEELPETSWRNKGE